MPYKAQYQWLSHWGMRGTKPTVARVRSVKLGEHHGFVVINRRIKATPEHPFLVRRGDEWGFVSAEFIKKGDYLIGERLAEELVQSVDRVDAPTRTVSIYVPGTNVYSAEGGTGPKRQGGGHKRRRGRGGGDGAPGVPVGLHPPLVRLGVGPHGGGGRRAANAGVVLCGGRSNRRGGGGGSMSGSSSSGGGTGTYSI